ncbi:MAG: CsbD family protein [Bryobacteraceae bacterium]
MNWDQVEGRWKRFTGSARERWGKLTDNNRERFAGKKDQLAGRIQEHYGVVRADAEKRADERALAQKGSARDRRGATRL